MEDYAYVLKDMYGRDSFYRRYKDEVAYMPPKRCPSDNDVFRTTQIDVNTMEILNRIFIKDSKRVYRMGFLLKGIDPADFHNFNCTYTGNHQVIYTPYGDAEVAHPESFEVLDEGGFTPLGRKFPDGVRLDNGKSTDNAYYHHSYGRDEEFVYFFTQFTETRKAVRLRACHNPVAFEVIDMGYMIAVAKDDKHVYYENHAVKNADPKTFEYIGDGYWRDGRHVFFHSHIVEGADTDSFKIVKPKNGRTDATAADKNNYYECGRVVYQKTVKE
ncbi:MAG: DKNYY domain-containing protein [Oscillospiraceae bacterium]|nr:DKNYY domain-containing protein [Oscillospiraceae bacterium]